MLILFGPYGRGDWVCGRYVEDNATYFYQSDFDLLVVTENRAHATAAGKARLSDAIGRRLRRFGRDQPSSTIIVADIKHLNDDLRRGNYFLAGVMNEGVLLFDSGRHTLAEVGAVDPLKSQRHAQEDFRYRFTTACEFFDATFDDIEKGRFNKAAFELHQAAERFFNAVVLTFARYDPKTHDLEKLDRLASNLHPDFFTVFPRATEQQKRCFDLLKKAYIDARYKRDFAITRQKIEFLIVRVRTLRELTERLYEERIAGMV